ncbi:MAG: hypothetical protein C4294_17865 [Nitrospiraceae bacterium]
MRFPLQKRLIIDLDTIAVIGLRGDPHDLKETRERLVIALHHIPSLSVINIDLSGMIVYRSYGSIEGQNRLEALIADQALMKTLMDFLAAYAANCCPS